MRNVAILLVACVACFVGGGAVGGKVSRDLYIRRIASYEASRKTYAGAIREMADFIAEQRRRYDELQMRCEILAGWTVETNGAQSPKDPK